MFYIDFRLEDSVIGSAYDRYNSLISADMHAIFRFAWAFFLALVLVGCGGEETTTVVDSGTYEGTISELNVDEREIYVDVPNTGTLELYFTDSTRVLRDSVQSSFDSLSVDQKVAVEVEKVGQRLDPVTVQIMN